MRNVEQWRADTKAWVKEHETQIKRACIVAGAVAVVAGSYGLYRYLTKPAIQPKMVSLKESVAVMEEAVEDITAVEGAGCATTTKLVHKEITIINMEKSGRRASPQKRREAESMGYALGEYSTWKCAHDQRYHVKMQGGKLCA